MKKIIKSVWILSLSLWMFTMPVIASGEECDDNVRFEQGLTETDMSVIDEVIEPNTASEQSPWINEDDVEGLYGDERDTATAYSSKDNQVDSFQ